jgi:hypothetical protein
MVLWCRETFMHPCNLLNFFFSHDSCMIIGLGKNGVLNLFLCDLESSRFSFHFNFKCERENLKLFFFRVNSQIR